MEIKQDKLEVIEFLRILKRNCHRGDMPRQTIIEEVSEESFLWVINQTIALIKDNHPDYKDI